MDNIKLSEKLAEVLKIDALPPEEQQEFLSRVGNVILDSSVMRLLTSLEESEVESLEKYIDSGSQEDDVFEHLLKTYPNFEKIVEEEAAALQSNFAEVMLPEGS